MKFPQIRARICQPLRNRGIDSQPGEISSLESIPGPLKRLQFRAQASGQISKDDMYGFSLDICFMKVLQTS